MLCENDLERQGEKTQPRKMSDKRHLSLKQECVWGNRLRRDPPLVFWDTKVVGETFLVMFPVRSTSQGWYLAFSLPAPFLPLPLQTHLELVEFIKEDQLQQIGLKEMKSTNRQCWHKGEAKQVVAILSWICYLIFQKFSFPVIQLFWLLWIPFFVCNGSHIVNFKYPHLSFSSVSLEAHSSGSEWRNSCIISSLGI